MTATNDVVLLYGSGFEAGYGSALATESSRLGEVLARPEGVGRVDIISVGVPARTLRRGEHLDLGEVDPGRLDAAIRRFGGERLRRRLAGSPLGRLLNSMGPLDAGRTFARRVRRSPAARAAIRRADIVIAVDGGGVIVAARALRRRHVREAYYDTRSAVSGLAEVVEG
jgi:S1-C subfamily serine protease